MKTLKKRKSNVSKQANEQANKQMQANAKTLTQGARSVWYKRLGCVYTRPYLVLAHLDAHLWMGQRSSCRRSWLLRNGRQ